MDFSNRKVHRVGVAPSVFSKLHDRLLAHADSAGHWQGRLSDSALASSVAMTALAVVDLSAHREVVQAALRWLVEHQNEDGGWGDSPESPSNLTTTLLSWTATHYVHDRLGRAGHDDACIRRAQHWLVQHIGGVTADAIVEAVTAAYGNDRTFAAPILAMCAITGRLGENGSAWRLVPQLPFELATLPRAAFRWLPLRVVSYALPALVAVGLARHRHAPSRSVLCRTLRNRSVNRALTLVERIQPEHGGFLEAAPLTGFVLMCLADADFATHPVATRAVSFLTETVRPSGAWPIDTDLAIWVTTLAAGAICSGPDGPAALPAELRNRLRPWLLEQQFCIVHPYTGAAPGGWGWTDRAGAVPDADDTAGALLALRQLGPADAAATAAAAAGVCWLLGLQNRDGGMPTFCRGWGRLPFDRSCPDITAHVVQAWSAWHNDLPCALRRRVEPASRRALAYLGRVQREEGAWVPLWFGNQQAANGQNRTYGTAKVVSALSEVVRDRPDHSDLRTWATPCIDRGIRWLLTAQNDDGGWGGGTPGCPSTVEETSLALEALADRGGQCAEPVRRGVEWLLAEVNKEASAERAGLAASPIGLYFASLWYSEQLYPLIFATRAFGRLAARTRRDPKQDSSG